MARCVGHIWLRDASSDVDRAVRVGMIQCPNSVLVCLLGGRNDLRPLKRSPHE